jgi:hypothetical protein
MQRGDRAFGEGEPDCRRTAGHEDEKLQAEAVEGTGDDSFGCHQAMCPDAADEFCHMAALKVIQDCRRLPPQRVRCRRRVLGTGMASPAAPALAPTAGQIVTVAQPADPPAHHAPARPLIQRRRRLLAGLVAAAAAAAVTVPMLVAEAQPDAAGKGQSSGHSLTSSSQGQSVTASRPPALLGVYSGPGYGFNDPNSIAADGRHVWVLNGNDSATELDARTGARIKILSAARYGFNATFNDTAGIVDDGVDVWVGNENSVTEINAADGALVRTLRVPASANLHGWYTALVRAGGQLWGASPDTCRPYCVSSSDTGFYASVIEFGASDGSYVRAISKNTIQAPVALASDGAHVWLVGSDVHGKGTTGTVIELDASDGRQLWSAPTTIYSNPQATTYDSIAYADGFLWVANGKTVTELNASNGKLVRVLSGAQYKFNGPTVVATAGANVLVVNAGGNSVTEIDARTGALVHTLSAARYHFDSPDAIAVSGSHAWILNSPSGSPSSVVELAL